MVSGLLVLPQKKLLVVLRVVVDVRDDHDHPPKDDQNAHEDHHAHDLGRVSTVVMQQTHGNGKVDDHQQQKREHPLGRKRRSLELLRGRVANADGHGDLPLGVLVRRGCTRLVPLVTADVDQPEADANDEEQNST